MEKVEGIMNKTQDFPYSTEAKIDREQIVQRWRWFRSMSLIILLGLIILSSGFLLFFTLFVHERSRTSGTGLDSYSVIFTSSISYVQALNMITNLGLQPGMLCNTSSSLSTPGQQRVQLWQQMGQREEFSHDHSLFVVPSEYVPSDWLQRLHANIGVLNIKQVERFSQTCPLSQTASGTPTSGVAVPLRGDGNTIYTYITFQSSTTYTTSLYEVSNLGLLLADPCYKQKLENQPGIQFPWNAPPSWHPMSQVSTFNTTSTLLVETAPLLTSSLWQNQLHALPDAVSIKISAQIPC